MSLVLLHDELKNSWLRFSDPIEIFATNAVAEIPYYLKRIEAAVAYRGLWAVGFLSYDAAPAFDRSMKVRDTGTSASATRIPLLWFGLYEAPIAVAPPDQQTPNSAVHDQADYALGDWSAEITRPDYLSAIERVKEYIKEGDTYQVNFTYRQRASFEGSVQRFFGDLVARQPGGFGCLIDTSEFAIASVSPELFLRVNGTRVTTRPMKGTFPRGMTNALDADNAAALFHSEKNRAENLMIVDMMRNDLNRIARRGTVQVPKLFTIEQYPTVLQMTSTVTAETDRSWSELIGALFPCSSITGAPKIRTMEIISELESSRRGVYTGTIGYLAPDGDSQLNVAIRTVEIDKRLNRATYGIGGGIVWDSNASDEYDESRTKARVLATNPLNDKSIRLLETMRFDPGIGIPRLELHLSRLSESAQFFGIHIDLNLIRRRLVEACTEASSTNALRIRMLVGHNLELSITTTPLVKHDESSEVSARLAVAAVDRLDPFLYHKTTSRQVYDEAMASAPGFDDVLLYNADGEVTEFSIGNAVFEFDGQCVTPPVASGLLGGTMRRELLDGNELLERVVYVSDLERASKIYRVNSVRGRQRVRLTL